MKHKKIIALALSAMMLSSVPVTGSSVSKELPSFSVVAHAEDSSSNYVETHEYYNSVCEFVNGDTLIFRPIDPELNQATAAFYNNDETVNEEDIKNVIFEEGITDMDYIADDYRFRNVECVRIPSTLKRISGFGYCSDIKRVDIPDIEIWLNLEGANRILNYETSELELYIDGELLTDLVIPEGTTEIRDGAFDNYSHLKSVYIPASVTKIGECAIHGSIWGINDIESIVVSPENPVYNSGNGGNVIIETATKKLITGCKNSVIPEGTVTIGKLAFGACREMRSITLPDSVETIEDGAFCGCFALSEINFGKNLKEIGESAFMYCFCLREIKIPDSVKTIGSGAFGSSYLTNIVLGNGVETIGDYAFVYNISDNITIPESVKKVGFESLGYYAPENIIVYSRDVDLSESTIGLTESKNPQAAEELLPVVYEMMREYGDIYSDFYSGKITEEEAEARLDLMEKYQPLLDEIYEKYGEDALNGNEDEDGNVIYQALPGATITGYKGSTAEAYANEHGITFIAFEEECKHEHIEYNDYIAPTCTEPGFRGGSACLDCETVIDVPEYIPPTGHTVVTDKAVPVTCTASGLTEGSHCKVCGTVIQMQETITPVGHTDNDGDDICDVCGVQIPDETIIQITFFERIRKVFANIFDKIFNIFKRFFNK